jgi:alpha/beta superfamily hydrolase
MFPTFVTFTKVGMAGVAVSLRRARTFSAGSDEAAMLSDYRNWLEAEHKLLANASHHAYSFGQANMAKRALERLDHDLAGRAVLLLERPGAAAALAALESLAAAGSLDPALADLRTQLAAALAAGKPV